MPSERGRSSNAAAYAFYYDTITVVAGAGLAPVVPGQSGSGGTGGGGGGVTPDLPGMPVDPLEPYEDRIDQMSGDDILENWLRDREKEFSRMGEFRDHLLSNFEQYGSDGESSTNPDQAPPVN